MTISSDMENAIKLIAMLKPEPVNPLSLINVGGVRVLSHPAMPENTIMVSDDVYSTLKIIAEDTKKNDNNTNK